MMILVAGPYRSGTGDDPAKLQANVDTMNDVAVHLFRRGHLPVTGEALALPLIEPISVRLLGRCDAVLRVGGSSAGADEMVRQARAEGKPVYTALDQIPVPE
ncbi:hypothetical protein GCM10010399_44870 [Dactylosporangium fulvum]|uniref:DUF4406 domain-containing protein n=1 Tax=Dactylosporangium fulvum TaxID=53359 RepID=A0ABY5W9V4_9ACTN|nr:DUF4406 domain-containing protein [Dactylosporangium fulvum]UWP86130.1 DUF4406 domain-containing protein [Dactylosporangium fulvum]